jgi:hypothetical protein
MGARPTRGPAAGRRVVTSGLGVRGDSTIPVSVIAAAMWGKGEMGTWCRRIGREGEGKMELLCKGTLTPIGHLRWRSELSMGGCWKRWGQAWAMPLRNLQRLWPRGDCLAGTCISNVRCDGPASSTGNRSAESLSEYRGQRAARGDRSQNLGPLDPFSPRMVTREHSVGNAPTRSNALAL